MIDFGRLTTAIVPLLNSTVAHRRRVDRRDSHGATVGGFESVESGIACSVQPARSDSATLADRDGATITHRVYRAGVWSVADGDRLVTSDGSVLVAVGDSRDAAGQSCLTVVDCIQVTA
jgi:head-tail adaptor